MPTDPDQIRVDLLRIKRQLYISYPEGSKERKDFMLASKMSELSYLQHLATPDMVDIVFEEYFTVLKAEITHFVLEVSFGWCLSVMLLGFHKLHPANVWLSPWYMPGIIGMLLGSTHVYHLFLNWKRLQPFKKEYALLQGKIAKLLEEIRGLAK